MANYNYITKFSSPNYTKGRTQPITTIVIHHWGDPKTNPTASGVVSWLNNPTSRVSAHYVITGTNREVYHLVNNKDTAWHAMQANPFSIGLELDPRYRDEDYDVAAEVIANIWKHYGKELPLKRHSDYVNTQCPGAYDLNRLHREAKAKMGDAPAKPTEPKPAEPKPPAHPSVLGSRGYLMRGDQGSTILRINRWFRTAFPAYAPQAVLGPYFGPVTENTVKEFQRRAKEDGRYNDNVDGYIGPLTYNAMKSYGFR